MATLATAISTAITKSLLTKLPAEASTKFDIDETEFKEFLQGFLSIQLKGGAKGGRSAGPKGKNGKGRISGYILFSNANRESVKEEDADLKFTEVGKRLGEMWGELNLKEKADWNSKASKQNEDNGLPTPTPTPTPTPGLASAKSATTKASAKKPAAKAVSGGMKIARHQESKAWVVQGTSFVVQSPKNKAVVGKLRANKVVALSAADRKKCQESGWDVKAQTSTAKPKDAAKSKAKPVESESKAKPVESESEGDDEGSDDDDSE
jgi:hypothetical protein